MKPSSHGNPVWVKAITKCLPQATEFEGCMLCGGTAAAADDVVLGTAELGTGITIIQYELEL